MVGIMLNTKFIESATELNMSIDHQTSIFISDSQLIDLPVMQLKRT